MARAGAAVACAAVLCTAAVVPARASTAPAEVGHVKIFALPDGITQLADGTAGPGRNIWFIAGRWILRITHSGRITTFPLHDGFGADLGITAGADGNLWFPEWNDPDQKPFMGRMSPSGVVTDFALPAGIDAYKVAAGPDGNVWFTANNGVIGRITKTGSVATFRAPGADLNAITGGPDGNVWFTEANPARIGRVTPAGAITEFDLPGTMRADRINGITTGPDGNIWFTDAQGRGYVAYMKPDGTFVRSWRPRRTPVPAGIVTGPDGALWYAANGGSEVGRVTVDGVFTHYLVVSGHGDFTRPTIARGRDGDLWLPLATGAIYEIARVDGT